MNRKDDREEAVDLARHYNPSRPSYLRLMSDEPELTLEPIIADASTF